MDDKLKEMNIKSNIECEPITGGLFQYFTKFKTIRNFQDNEKIEFFEEGFKEHRLNALKLLFYLRDVRGGLGERESFRVILNYLGNNYPEVVKVNLELIAHYGRWDDLYSLFYTPVENDVINLFRKTLKEDIEKDVPSFLAKWLKSSNTSSKESRALANRTINKIGLTHRQYRKTLAYLRKKINVVEINLSKKDYAKIDYEKMPLKALKRYKNTFLECDAERYLKYKKNNIIAELENEEDRDTYEFMVKVIKSDRYKLIKMI